MCICVNCHFYSTCWINNGLLNFPTNYNQLIKNMRSFREIKWNKNSQQYIPITLDIQLNISPQNYIREPDIIFCDSFIERPGNWLNKN